MCVSLNPPRRLDQLHLIIVPDPEGEEAVKISVYRNAAPIQGAVIGIKDTFGGKTHTCDCTAVGHLCCRCLVGNKSPCGNQNITAVRVGAVEEKKKDTMRFVCHDV